MSNQPLTKLRYSSREAAHILGISEAKLSLLRQDGSGPRFSCLGTPGTQGCKYFYHIDDLQNWSRNQDRYGSIAEYHERNHTSYVFTENLK